MSKHTLGPWETHVIKESVSVFGPDNFSVAFMYETHRFRPRETAIANARLIAASPDMYEFVQWILTLKTGGMIEGRARALVQKVEDSDDTTE